VPAAAAERGESGQLECASTLWGALGTEDVVERGRAASQADLKSDTSIEASLHVPSTATVVTSAGGRDV
jgi:hypothetical protein